MEKWKAMLVALLLGGLGLGQTLVEVTAVAALASSLDPAVRLPSGTYKARSPEPLLQRFPEARGYTLEAFAAKGIASRLHAAFVQQVLTGFAAAGYFLESQEEKVVAGEVRTKYVLKDSLGRPALLLVVRKGEELVYGFGKAK
ncbi:MAG: hypothetical protein NZ846_08450 [Thermus sp.]|uniref:hypothetical protein n=1 Tax=unclassified Thermus TaxID=2619321 RepID=UPI000238A3E3|nr:MULTISPECIES: hypothetical protein [unclassified Thermus]AEV16291.1 hypothetical protein TCCBUS3UF1_12480 [Thermus sp. CCB_US3_UF1]MCS6867305.1 hypothetical protein [Thermus sp.]MCS7218986.1 hypothetical protein [Thermus sp.]MCX7850372.1 hypothetical protein [Thermus sp.]MDW8018061.1 hypothetical protein [Thermus sp.]